MTIPARYRRQRVQNVTAAGSSQGTAAAIALEIAVVSGADGTKGVVLPAAVPGGPPITVINTNGSSQLPVYPASGAAINALSANTAINVPPLGIAIFDPTSATQWYTAAGSDGSSLNLTGNLTVGGFIEPTPTNAITAHSGGGQGSATALTTMYNRLTTVAAAGDSVVLPASVAGMMIVVANDGAAPADVFPAGSEVINNQAASIAVRCPVGGVLVFFCEVAGTWNCQLPGKRFVSAGASGAVAVQAETAFATNQYSIPAGVLRAGTRLRARGQGTVTTANGTLQIRVRLGGVSGVLVMDTGNAITPSNGDIFAFDLSLAVIDVGATGHVYGTFTWTIGTAGTGTTRSGKTASIAIDTTSAQNLVVTQQNGTGAGSITLDYLEVFLD